VSQCASIQCQSAFSLFGSLARTVTSRMAASSLLCSCASFSASSLTSMELRALVYYGARCPPGGDTTVVCNYVKRRYAEIVKYVSSCRQLLDLSRIFVYSYSMDETRKSKPDEKWPEDETPTRPEFCPNCGEGFAIDGTWKFDGFKWSHECKH